MVTKNIELGSPGTHFIYMRVKNVLRVHEMYCIILIFKIFSSKYFAKSFGAFFSLKFSSNTGTDFLHLLIDYAFLGVTVLANFQ